MASIAFFDIETDWNGKNILDIGACYDDGRFFHENSLDRFSSFIKGVDFVCGHNIFQHDLKFLSSAITLAGITPENAIDTLVWSPLLFPQQPYHRLLKDDKLQTDAVNNPLNDAQKARALFHDEVVTFLQLDPGLKEIFYDLLHNQPSFLAFFSYLDYKPLNSDLAALIHAKFQTEICENSNIAYLSARYPIALAYALALIHCRSRFSLTPPWVLKNYPEVESVMANLRNKPCLEGCVYCRQRFDIFKGLKDFFGFDGYRVYDGQPLQENAVRAAIQNRSLLAVFPTGGGKSITFQVPALMNGLTMKALTVVISPLQSLMKDQVDNLERAGITEAVTINGLLDPIERAKSFERVANGSASLLYISPESLRSKTIEHLLLGRKIARFVVDEAHCFSAWGQDFRVDYLYIADFIKNLQEKKNLSDPIPVSCFTATAKQKVIEDICAYFREKLNLELDIFKASANRSNLHYKVFEKEGDDEKYNALRNLIEEKNCPTIVYVSRTRKASELAKRLAGDGFKALAFHGKMDATEKTENQDTFIKGDVQIMVATSAFGMGVDKKDVGLVIHFDISDSLENYVQEAGRAGRDEKIEADCYVLFSEDDLSKHFVLLNQTKLNIQEIKQIWDAIKFITKYRKSVSNSPLEIARRAGWDDSVSEIETRVITAIAALEEAGYLRRGQNMPRIYANSILSKTAQEAIDKIRKSARFDNERQRENAVRIIRKLFSSKSKAQATDTEAAESRIDYISDHLGIVKEEVIQIINLLREEKILADAKDLSAFIKRGEHKNRSLAIIENFRQIEQFLLTQFDENEREFSLKTLNEAAEVSECKGVSPQRIKTILNFWAIKNWIKRAQRNFSNQIIVVKTLNSRENLLQKLNQRHTLSCSIIDFLYEKSKITQAETGQTEEVLVEFSVLELKENFERLSGLFQLKTTPEAIEDALFYLSRIEAMKIEGGFMVVYNRLNIVRLEENNKIQYKNEDYQKLNQFYENKIQQIHIVGEYAKKMVYDYVGALRFVDDYFQLNYSSFLGKYFPGTRGTEIKRNITPAKYRQLFESLSEIQRQVIDDSVSPHIVVAAGPGSGKTKVLTHKLAALLLLEDVKHEQLLMLTFSRAAATEFKKRLIGLIGNAALFVEIKTFHSYCFDLLGRVGNLEKSDSILQNAITNIRNGEIEINRITKAVLVIDEAQDMNADEFALVKVLMEKNEGLRVIAVGDDDQNIYEFRGSDSGYMRQLIDQFRASKYELTTNYRSSPEIVAFANTFVKGINTRMKIKEILPAQTAAGHLKLVHYQSKNLIVPLVSDLLATDLSGTTCVLTKTNEEAAQITGLLIQHGRRAKLIQSNDEFALHNLLEVRFFIDALGTPTTSILPENWETAKRTVYNEFKSSPNFEIVVNLVKDFHEINPKSKYWSDFQTFVRESKIENFYRQENDTIFVSTIHKAKGREFEHVFILLNDIDDSNDVAKRQIYVALTRAQKSLVIHTNTEAFNHIHLPDMQRIENSGIWQAPLKIAVQLTMRDINLGYFSYHQQRISALTSGQYLQIQSEGLSDSSGKLILKFSKKFHDQIDLYQRSGYAISEAKVNFIVYWTNKETEKEIKVVLPGLIFEKRSIT
ncbi:MAG: RecQ family ATP-dependent DNA helicase [Chitinophagales bacterium]|nr:RecQ family ATP-dependent DNA helicase [Chitinophagales bacterium]